MFAVEITQEFSAKLEDFFSKRLRPSSQSTITTAVNKHWLPFVEQHHLDEYIPSASYKRGSIMAAFVITLALAGLAYSTICGYVWGVTDWHLAAHHASPIANVRDWSLFMRAVEVQTSRPHEPRKMLPWKAFISFFKAVDLTSPVEVACATFACLEFHTISRAELLPKAQQGPNGWDPKKHFCTCDVRTSNGYLEVCIKAKKQDPLSQRPTAYLGEEWIPIGECSGGLDLAMWLGLYSHLKSSFSATPSVPDAFFLRPDGQLITDSYLLTVFRRILARMEGWSTADASSYAFTGIRVLSMNVHSKSEAGRFRVDRNWSSNAKYLYSRKELQQCLDFASTAYDLAASGELRMSPLEQGLQPLAATEPAPHAAPEPMVAATTPVRTPPSQTPENSDDYETVYSSPPSGKPRKFYKYNGKLYPSLPQLKKAMHSTSHGMHNPAMAPTPFAQAAPSSSCAIVPYTARNAAHTFVPSEHPTVQVWVGTKACTGEYAPQTPKPDSAPARQFGEIMRVWKQVVECWRRISQYEDDLYNVGGDDIMGTDTSMPASRHMADSDVALTNLYRNLHQYQQDLELLVGFTAPRKRRRS